MPEKKSEAVIMDWQKAVNHANEVKQHLMGFAGKGGYNPHLYINRVIDPLLHAYDKGEASKALYDKLVSLKKVEPTVDSKGSLTASLYDVKVEEPVKQTSSAQQTK